MNEDHAPPKPTPPASSKVPRWLKVIVLAVIVGGVCATIACLAFVLDLFAPNVSDLFAPAPAMIQAVMVNVPAGEFTMGNDDEFPASPAHLVYLDSFAIDKYLVTNAQYRQCVDAGKCAAPKKSGAFMLTWYYGVSKYNNHPLVNVTWFDAQKYCEWAGKHLPTEAQWEKAARGTDVRLYPWGNLFDATKVNVLDVNDPKVGPFAVGSYPAGASPYGVLDMIGNVNEWVADWYGEYPGSPQRNPTGSATETGRVMRGSHMAIEGLSTTTSRTFAEPTDFGDTTGFRCAK